MSTMGGGAPAEPAKGPEADERRLFFADPGDPEKALGELASLLDQIEEEAAATLGRWFTVPPKEERTGAEWRERITDFAGRLNVTLTVHGEHLVKPRAEGLPPKRRRALPNEEEAVVNAAIQLRNVALWKRELERGNLARVAAGLAEAVLILAATADYHALLAGEASLKAAMKGRDSANLPPRRGRKPRGRPARRPNEELDAFATKAMGRSPRPKKTPPVS